MVICHLCKWGKLRAHPELMYYLKCPICGYCQPTPANELTIEDRQNSIKHPLLKRAIKPYGS